MSLFYNPQKEKAKNPDAVKFIAVAFDGKSNTEYFERTDTYWLFYLQDGRVRREQYLSLFNKGMDDKIMQFKRSMIDGIICKGFSPKPMAKLRASGIKIYEFDGGTKMAIEKLLKGELKEI